MVPCARFALGLLLLPALSGAFEHPRFTFDDYTTPDFEAKTFYQSIRAVYRYGSDPAFDSSLVRILDSLGYVKDTVAQTLTLQEAVEFTVQTDASERLESVESRSMGSNNRNDMRSTFLRDTQGRISLQFTRSIQDSSTVDSSVFTWRHPKCADQRRTRSGILREIVWTVDNQGRCLEGVRNVWSETTQSWIESEAYSWTWGPSGPTQEVTTRNDLDTTQIHRITYENGLPVRDTVMYPRSSDNSKKVCENTYDQGTFQEQRCHSEGGASSTVIVLSLKKPAGVLLRPARSLLAIEAAALPGMVQFTNRTDERVRLQVVRISGARMETLVLEPGQTNSVAAAKGPIVWRALSPSGSRSGVLQEVR
jgi:hypothetical protein